MAEKQKPQPKELGHLAQANQEHRGKKSVLAKCYSFHVSEARESQEIERKLLAMPTFQLLVFPFFGYL